MLGPSGPALVLWDVADGRTLSRSEGRPHMNNGSSILILILSIGGILLLGLPLLLFPMSWARRVGWKVPVETDLANYLGRSAGAAAMATSIMGLMVARDPLGYRPIFDLVIWSGIFLTGVHAYGFIKRVQPWFENVEVALYPLVSLLAWIFYPRTG
jgi:hypothetical protein